MNSTRKSRQIAFEIQEEVLAVLLGRKLPWKRIDLTPSDAESIRMFLGKDDAIGAFISGSIQNMRDEPGGGYAAGICFARLEPETKRRPGEPEINVYHYKVGEPKDGKYPVYGPFLGGGPFEHWPEWSEFVKVATSE